MYHWRSPKKVLFRSNELKDIIYYQVEINHKKATPLYLNTKPSEEIVPFIIYT